MRRSILDHGIFVFSSLLLAVILLRSTEASALEPASVFPLASETYSFQDLGDDDIGHSRGSSLSGTRFGLGIVLGRPTGLTGKLFLGGTHALQLHMGWGLESETFILIFDYLFHAVGLIPATPIGRFVPYVGIGGRFGIHHEDGLLGLRIPLGMALLIRGTPVEIFVEIAPGIGLLPETDAVVDGGLGARFYF